VADLAKITSGNHCAGLLLRSHVTRGTPISNSLGELWVMQTYLRPDLLEQAGVADLGDWGAAFTATTTTSRSRV
jgi:N12 class adenine-specific DNA methylase